MFQRPQVPTISPQEVAERLARDPEAEQPVVIDVREPDEWEEGHIAGATLIPLGTLGAQISEIPTDRDVVLVCHSGQRSALATAMLRRAGNERALNMAGGMVAWEEGHLPIAG
jgi:rhodanese-related sulfurtransferase